MFRQDSLFDARLDPHSKPPPAQQRPGGHDLQSVGYFQMERRIFHFRRAVAGTNPVEQSVKVPLS